MIVLACLRLSLISCVCVCPLFHSECDRENQAATEDPFAHPVSTTNFKLEEGKKITVKIAGKTGGRTRPAGGSGSGFLAPPKEKHTTGGSGGLLAPPAPKPTPSANQSNSVFGFDNSFGDALSSTTQQNQPQSSRFVNDIHWSDIILAY